MGFRILRISSLVLAIVSILVVGILYFYKFPKEVDVVLPAVSFIENDSSSINRLSIHVQGTLYRPVFRQHTFQGKVLMDSYNFSKENSTLLIITKRQNGVNMGALHYQATSKPFDFVASSMIWFDDDFELINIWGDWNKNEVKNESFFIVTASSYEQAIAVQKKLREKFGSDDWFVPKA